MVRAVNGFLRKMKTEGGGTGSEIITESPFAPRKFPRGPFRGVRGRRGRRKEEGEALLARMGNLFVEGH